MTLGIAVKMIFQASMLSPQLFMLRRLCRYQCLDRKGGMGIGAVFEHLPCPLTADI